LEHESQAMSLSTSSPVQFEVEWRVPVGCGFSGFFTEVALGFVPGLHDKGVAVRLLTGKCDDAWLDAQLEARDAATYRATWADENARSAQQTHGALVIEHGEPCSMRRWQSSSARPWRVVARTMTESSLKAEQAACLRHADEIWVPTAWHVDTFVAAGIARSLLHVVPEPVDVDFFHPNYIPSVVEEPSDGPLGWWKRPSAKVGDTPAPSPSPFVFLSSFKWEWRKGWDLLLEAYWCEFTSARERSAVQLVIHQLPPLIWGGSDGL
jgi:hypothetical protein